MFAFMTPSGQGDPLEGNGTLQRNFDGSLFNSIAIDGWISGGTCGESAIGSSGGSYCVKVPLDLVDAEISGQEPFAVESLQHGADTRSMNHLQDKKMRLKRGRML